MQLGLVGLGNMGLGLGSRLLAAGHDLTVYNRTASKAQPLLDRGARRAERVADACRSEAVISMLADDAALADLVWAPDGILAALPPGSTHISMSTISVSLSERLAHAHAQAGQAYVAAPVLGRPDAAAAGRLFILAAGASDAVAKCAPVFECLGQKTFVMGAHAQMANLVKLSANFLIAAVIEALGEAMALTAKGGIDQHEYLEMLTSTLFNAPVYKTYGELILRQKFEPAGFAAPLGFKDIRLTVAAAEANQTPMPLASLLHDRFLTLIACGGQSLDWSAIGALAARDAGMAQDHHIRSSGTT